ncbi:peptidylprolyl isomerase [Lentibacillus cibarius]|uniref:Peptidylprolyl isomerase n=1 Tax=Lentibacillus cibarius TaxID=2583219 RepID=A0A549YHE3_9BACI|nr:SurA N-terminal domain-containing protein [Lentibacillus cibarius]TRM11310.1 peptidylprolyl isomerase [Lentibacillus cibarius]
MKKLLMSLIALSLAVVLAACGGDDEGSDDKQDKGDNENGQASQQQDMPKPDLKNIPDVVAKVNGEEIKKQEFKSMYQSNFQQMAMQSQLTGQKLDQDKMKKQIADLMVNNELLIQEANNRDYSASDKDVDEKLNDMVKQFGMESKDKMLSNFEEQGMKEEEVVSQVKTQVKVDKLVAEESGGIEPTEKEIKEAYDQWKKQQQQAQKNDKDDKDGENKEEDKEIASFDEKKSELKQAIKNQKQQQELQTIVEKLRKDADVTVNL